MNARASLYQLWDFAIPAEADSSQAWVLSAMKTHGPELVRLLWRILGCEQEVCDAYQETFLNLAHYRSGSKPENVKSYLFRTASNTAISILRRKGRIKNGIQNYSKIKSSEQNSVQDFDHEQISQQLRNLVAKLPRHLQDVVLLREFGEMSYHKVARILNITESTARVYRCKAVQLLAIWLNEEQTK